MGKSFPRCQGTLSPWDGKELPVATNSVSPRKILARNLKALIAVTGVKAPEIARRAKIDRKTVNNQINARFDPRPELVDAVAAVFGIEGWLLMSESFDPETSVSVSLSKVIEYFNDSDKEGRENILRVAQMAAKSKR